MKSVCCYIGLGSNLHDPGRQIESAVNSLRENPYIRFDTISTLYRSKAIGPSEQPDYCNAVAKIHTDQEPHGLLDILQAIESSQGRDRSRELRWGARTLDLDILLYGDAVINDSLLSIPHVEIKNRNFVLIPLADIAPDLYVPNLGLISDLLAKVDGGQLEPWSEVL